MKRLRSLVVAGLLLTCSASPGFAEGSGDLAAAAAQGDEARVVALLTQGAAIDARDTSGYTPLIWAALKGHGSILIELLKRGAAIDAQDREGYSALMWAAQNRRAAIVSELLARKANPNLKDKEGYTALTWAAQDGQAAIAEQLLKGGAQVDMRDKEGYTALMWAAQQGHSEVVKVLVKHGADRALKDRKGFTAADLAGAFNRPTIKQFLLVKAIAKPAVKPVAVRPAAWPRPAAAGTGNPPVAKPVATTAVAWTTPALTPVAVANVQPSAPRGLVVSGKGQPRWGGPRLVAVVQTPPYEYATAVASAPAARVVTKPAPRRWRPKLTRPVTAKPVVMQPKAAVAAVATVTTAAPSLLSIQERLRAFDVDGNKVVDGNDWRRLVTTRRLALATILHDVRCNKRFCTPGHANSVIDKLDWVYTEAGRLKLTPNMAYDFPMPNGGTINW